MTGAPQFATSTCGPDHVPGWGRRHAPQPWTAHPTYMSVKIMTEMVR